MSYELNNKIGTGDCELDPTHKAEQTFASIIAADLVSEILEDALDIVEEIEEKASLKAVEYIRDKFPTESSMIPEKLPLKGLGDQLEPDEGLGEETPTKHRLVEKKSRLTDLVKNSKQMLAKLIQNENGQEKVLRIVELDSGEEPYKSRAPSGAEEELKLCSSHDKGTQRGELYTRNKKTMTFPMASGSGKHLSLAERYRTLKFPGELKTKKWNIGTKIVSYIRKRQSKKEGKNKEQQASDGVEFNPRDDDV